MTHIRRLSSLSLAIPHVSDLQIMELEVRPGCLLFWCFSCLTAISVSVVPGPGPRPLAQPLHAAITDWRDLYATGLADHPLPLHLRSLDRNPHPHSHFPRHLPPPQRAARVRGAPAAEQRRAEDAVRAAAGQERGAAVDVHGQRRRLDVHGASRGRHRPRALHLGQEPERRLRRRLPHADPGHDLGAGPRLCAGEATHCPTE